MRIIVVCLILIALCAGFGVAQVVPQNQPLDAVKALELLHNVAYKYMSLDGDIKSIPRTIEDTQAIEQAYTALKAVVNPEKPVDATEK